jgi:hypothetical protein
MPELMLWLLRVFSKTDLLLREISGVKHSIILNYHIF